MTRSFDDPKPKPERRRQQLIFLRPMLKAEIEKRRGNLTRSAWIERAIAEKIARDDRGVLAERPLEDRAK